MSLLKSAFTSVAFLGAGLFTMTPNDADAQIRVQIGGNGYGYNNGFGHHRGFGNYGDRGTRYDFDGRSGHRHGTGYRGYNDGWRGNHGHHGWNTTVRHGNRYHVQPGHVYYRNHDSYRQDGFGQFGGHHHHH